MAANRSQGSYYTLFLVAATVLCAGIFVGGGKGKLLLLVGASRASRQPFRDAEDQVSRGQDSDEARPGDEADRGSLPAWGG